MTKVSEVCSERLIDPDAGEPTTIKTVDTARRIRKALKERYQQIATKTARNVPQTKGGLGPNSPQYTTETNNS